VGAAAEIKRFVVSKKQERNWPGGKEALPAESERMWKWPGSFASGPMRSFEQDATRITNVSRRQGIGSASCTASVSASCLVRRRSRSPVPIDGEFNPEAIRRFKEQLYWEDYRERNED
jgi:hypothetical protein